MGRVDWLSCRQASVKLTTWHTTTHLNYFLFCQILMLLGVNAIRTRDCKITERLVDTVYVLIMQIVQIRLFVCLSPTRTCRPLADWCSSTIVLAAVSGAALLGNADHGCPRCFLSANSPPRPPLPVKFMLAAGAYSWRS